ncbi:MAG: hypothetical protein Athens041674_461 [Parcubacteria group bacterium Athens0416_74]|nr:MAG: hypothetical protein Athens041674_461 [Parcubacteria group bacterium Athens0416_74]
MSEAPKRERRLSTEPHEEFGLGHEAPVSDLVSVNRNGEEIWVHPSEVAQVLNEAKKTTSAGESGPSPDTKRVGPDIPAGKKAREAFLKGVREVGRNFGLGEHKVKDESVFRAALGKYADYRTRWGEAEAFAAAVNDLDVDDVKAFRERATELEQELADKNLSKPEVSSSLTGADGLAETIEKARKDTAAAPQVEQARTFGSPEEKAAVDMLDGLAKAAGEALKNASSHSTNHMSEEELLKGLEGLSEPEAASDTVPPHFETAYKRLIEKFRKDGTRREDQIPLASRGVIGNSEYAAFKAFVDERDAAAERAKQAAKSTRKSNAGSAGKEKGSSPTESAKDRDARLAALADDFDKQAGADSARAAELFQDIDATLSKEDREIFIEKVRGLGWKVNGDVHQESGSFELIPLGNTAEKLTEALGKPAGKVDGIPFWVLENGDGVVLSGGPVEGRYPQRFQNDGFSEIRGSFYEYKDGAFRKMSEKEVAARRAAAITENEQDKAAAKEKAREKGARERAQPEAERERAEPEVRAAERPARSETRSERPEREGSEKSRSFEEGLKIFLKTYKKEKRNAGTAFREAMKGLSDKNRKRLIDFLTDTTDIPRPILERIHRDVDEEYEREESGDGEKRPAPVEREVDRMLSSSRAQPRTSERRESRETENIDDEIDRMLGFK